MLLLIPYLSLFTFPVFMPLSAGRCTACGEGDEEK